MTPFVLAAVALGAAVATAWLTARLIGVLEGAAVLDVPNARSLHERAVPRGGGLAIAAVVLVLLGVLMATGRLPVAQGGGAVLAGAGFAALGWADDRADLPALLRLVVQLVLAGAVAFALLRTSGGAPVAGAWFAAALALGMVWHVNLFNFMDGADGLACAQTACAGLVFAGLLAVDGRTGLAVWAAGLGGAAAGFARWNWRPAKVFMGDVGSYFIGFQLALLVVCAWLAGLSAWPYLILLAPFVTDATLTLARRVVTGRAWWRAHRTHAYQRAILAGLAPDRLALGVAAYLLVVCAPAAWYARTYDGAFAAVFVYGLTGMIWLWMQRTRPESRRS